MVDIIKIHKQVNTLSREELVGKILAVGPDANQGFNAFEIAEDSKAHPEYELSQNQLMQMQQSLEDYIVKADVALEDIK